MAGSYPDVPASRMAYDAENVVVLVDTAMPEGSLPGAQPSNPVVMDPADVAHINDESAATAFVGAPGSPTWIGFVFPEKRNLDGIHVNVSGTIAEYSWIMVSEDTTNGIDGTWEQVVSLDAFWDDHAADFYRRPGVIQIIADTDIAGIGDAVTGVAIYVETAGSAAQNVISLHLYGNISVGQTADRLAFIDAEYVNIDVPEDEFTKPVFVKPLDFGDVPRGQTQVRQVILKNLSEAVTLDDVELSVEALTGASDAWYEFSFDDEAYTPTLAFGDMGPGEERLFYVRQAVLDTEPLGVEAARIKATHST